MKDEVIMEQRKSEWYDNIDIEYHTKQFNAPYRSTVLFYNWLNTIVDLDKGNNEILDLCCGAGANIFYANNTYMKNNYHGIELNNDLVKLGNSLIEERNILNLKLKQGDIYNLDQKIRKKFNGITMQQTFFMLPNYEEVLLKIFELEPEWVALSSLCYDGMIECKVEVTDYARKNNNNDYWKCNYDIHSLMKIKSICFENGYSNFKYVPYNIDIDLPKNNDGGLGTYTEKLEDGRRLQISGPLLMNWYFVFVGK